MSQTLWGLFLAAAFNEHTRPKEEKDQSASKIRENPGITEKVPKRPKSTTKREPKDSFKAIVKK